MNIIAKSILQTGAQRGLASNLDYAGALTPKEAFSVLEAEPTATLIDVRTAAERDWVGRVDIPENQHASVEWSHYPTGTENPDFLAQLKRAAASEKAEAAGSVDNDPTGKERVLLFLCRSGVRSKHAARKATQAGYRQCFDILEGFEGDKDDAGHRKTIAGWCQAGLPWIGA